MNAELRFVAVDWERFDRIERLLWDVLYRDFGVDPSSDWLCQTPDSIYAVALAGSHGLLGAARLLGPADGAKRQLRQVAVEPAMRGMGLGAELVLALEDRARAEGAREIWLNARDSAIPFYERLGYVAEGDEFVSELTGIPHRFMRRRLDVIGPPFSG